MLTESCIKFDHLFLPAIEMDLGMVGHMVSRKGAVFAALAILFSLLLPGCYPQRVGPAGPDGKALTWPEMTTFQRQTHMQQVVLPRAAALFRDWRPDRYSNATCHLCHGQGVDTWDFSMPTAHLPRLSGDALLGTEFEKYPDTTRLKLNRLVPEMSDALGLKSFSIITRKGFGCYSCHLGPDGPMFGN